MSQPIEQQKEEWEEEFREYFDKTLRPKKPTIKNLDRELCIDFIRRQRQSAREEGKREGMKQHHEKCTVGCPYYQSGHSINENGSCNMGCC